MSTPIRTHNNKNIISDNFYIVIDKIFTDFDENLLIFEDLKNNKFDIKIKYSIDGKNFINNKPSNGEFYVIIVGTKIISTPNKDKLFIYKNIDNELNLFEFSSIKYDNEILSYKFNLFNHQFNLTNTDFYIIVNKKFNNFADFDVNLLQFDDLKIEKYKVFVKFTTDKKTFLEEIAPNIEFYPVIIANRDNEINNLFEFSSIKYDGIEVDYEYFVFNKSIINNLPKWNVYDNQHINLLNWKNQIRAIAQMYGHQVTYFKTDPVKTSHTFQNNYVRDVVDIKKLMVVVPNNVLPEDRIEYTEWDEPMVDDVYFDIVDDVFKQAFGENEVPSIGDAIYFPLVNKYLRVTSVQPKNSFMGNIGWWQVYVSKYEEDESINFNEAISAAINNSTFEEEYQQMLNDGLITSEKIVEKTIEEKKEATENYTNKLVDNVDYIDLKETEFLRSFMHNRVEITKINVAGSAFPVTVYNLSGVERRYIAIVYELQQYTKNNLFELYTIDDLSFSFNLAVDKFRGNLIDLLDVNESIFFSISINNLKLEYNFASEDKVEVTTLNKLEFYQVNFYFESAEKKLTITIFTLNNGVKTIFYQNEYFVQNRYSDLVRLTLINVYGGKWFMNDLTLNINKNKILQDYCNPILNYN